MLLKYFLFLFLATCVFAATAKKCPEGSVPTATNPDMCYTWTNNTSVDDAFATYNDAEIACQQKGGHLATIPNQDENNYLSEITRKQGIFFWIGINDLETYGKWKWEDGSSANYLNWAKDQPSSNHCGSFVRFDGSWRTKECELKLLYLCSVPALLMEQMF